MTFASEIQENGFNNSQLEIDDRWESCYGEQTFDDKKFPDPKKMNDQLHSLVKNNSSLTTVSLSQLQLFEIYKGISRDSVDSSIHKLRVSFLYCC